MVVDLTSSSYFYFVETIIGLAINKEIDLAIDRAISLAINKAILMRKKVTISFFGLFL